MRWTFIAAGSAVLLASCGVVRELTQAEPINLTAGAITGEALDSASQRPLVGVELSLRPLGGDTSQVEPLRAFTYGPSGGFRFGSVPPGSYSLRAEFADYHPMAVTVNSVGVGERRIVTLRLSRR